jgi:undecaprenyl-diphosphatase
MISILILAIVQALTEFIPVSSSGHLLALQETTSIEGSLALDVALHIGTLIALTIYFWPQLRSFVLSPKTNQTTLTNIVLTSVPAVLAGVLFADFFAEDVRSLGIVIIMLVIVGLIMIFADRLFPPKDSVAQKINQISKRDAWVVGLGQAMALVPGTSRSGITILAARSRGLSSSVAAEYSFLAGIPVIAGAALKTLAEGETRDALGGQYIEVLVGILVAAGVGWFALNFLLGFLKKGSLALFGWYRLALALFLFIIWLN